MDSELNFFVCLWLLLLVFLWVCCLALGGFFLLRFLFGFCWLGFFNVFESSQMPTWGGINKSAMETLLAQSLSMRLSTNAVLRIRYRCKEPYRVNNTRNIAIEISSPDFHFQLQNTAIYDQWTSPIVFCLLCLKTRERNGKQSDTHILIYFLQFKQAQLISCVYVYNHS